MLPFWSSSTRRRRGALGPASALPQAAYSCPPATFGLDERTVAAWHQRAGAHSARVQQGLVEQPQWMGHVQADELRIKKQGGTVWVAIALSVASQLWLGAVVQVSRDGALAKQLAQLVRRCVAPGPLVWSMDGWAPYVTAILRVFRDPVRHRGRRSRHELALIARWCA